MGIIHNQCFTAFLLLLFVLFKASSLLISLMPIYVRAHVFIVHPFQVIVVFNVDRIRKLPEKAYKGIAKLMHRLSMLRNLIVTNVSII